MKVFFDIEKLTRLISNLQALTGIRTNIFDAEGKAIQLGGHTQFCGLINSCADGHARCEGCDAQAVEKSLRVGGLYSYRCHAGVWETVLPVYDSGLPVAWLVFGQLLDMSPVQTQWERCLKTLGWYQGDLEKLREAFFSLRRCSAQERLAYGEILEAIAKYIQQEGMIRSAEYTELQKLERYLDSHYMEELSLDSISEELHMGRTKLCALSKKLSGGKTLNRMIAERRVSAAKKLLIKSDEPVSAVAEKVGFSDYNYFTKIFKTIAGQTPSAYRKEHRK